MYIIGSESEFEAKQEEEFRQKCEEFAYYQGSTERLTLDKEWTETDLKDDVKDEVYKIIEEWKKKNKHRAIYNNNMLLDSYVSEEIINGLDLIEIYNTEYDKRREEGLFGIVYFDDWIKRELLKQLNKNLVK